jgi:hypothetical protein
MSVRGITLSRMGEPFLGSEAIGAGTLSKSALAWRFTAVYRDVYIDRSAELTPPTRAKAAWLWTHRRGVVAGFSAAALHGAKWVDPARPAELIHDNRRRASGVRVWGDRLHSDEICAIDGVPLTTSARTALDLACWYPVAVAVPAIDALAQATEVKLVDVDLLAQRYPGRRGIRRARASLQLVDAGAQSPKETWLRLLLIGAGLPRPQTQIAVRNEWGWAEAFLDMGWEELKVAVEYDGDQHRTDRRQYVKDIRRMELLESLGWIIVRVIAEDHPDDIVQRVRQALARRA